jgi:hypothetical protein
MVDGTSDQIQLRVQGNATQTTNLQTWENSGGTVLSSVNGVGHFGIGGVPTAGRKVNIYGAFDGTASQYGVYSWVVITPSADSASSSFGLGFQAQILGTKNHGSVYGVSGTCGIDSSATISNAVGFNANVLLYGTATVTNNIGYWVQSPGRVSGTSVIATNYGVKIDGQGKTYITHAYGLYISNISTAVTNNYAIYTNTGLNRFGDQLSIVGSADRIQLQVKANATQTTNVLSLETSAAAVNISMDNNGGAIFNEQGNSLGDFRVEGDTEVNLAFADYSADTIAFGGTGAAGATVSMGGHLTLPDINFLPSTPTTMSGDVNDYDLGTNTWIRLSGGAADRIITGIVARNDGHYMIITNIGTTNKISFSNESGSSTAANRIITAVGGTVELHAYESIFLIYDATTARWREVIHA